MSTVNESQAPAPAEGPITRDGSVTVGGKDLFDPAQPFWNGTAPVVKWPK